MCALGYLAAMHAIAAAIMLDTLDSLKHYLFVASHRFDMELEVAVFYLDRDLDLRKSLCAALYFTTLYVKVQLPVTFE